MPGIWKVWAHTADRGWLVVDEGTRTKCETGAKTRAAAAAARGDTIAFTALPSDRRPGGA